MVFRLLRLWPLWNGQFWCSTFSQYVPSLCAVACCTNSLLLLSYNFMWLANQHCRWNFYSFFASGICSHGELYGKLHFAMINPGFEPCVHYTTLLQMPLSWATGHRTDKLVPGKLMKIFFVLIKYLPQKWVLNLLLGRFKTLSIHTAELSGVHIIEKNRWTVCI